MNHPYARTAAAAILVIAAVAAGGCGGDHARPVAAAAPDQLYDPARLQDLVPLTTAQAARKAQRIALVVARGSRVVEGMPGTPFTRTQFDVQRVLKGRLPRTFVIEVIGGRLRNRFVTSLVPPFTQNHRYILFLGPDGRVGPTIFPQAVIEVGQPRAPPLHRLIASIQRSLSTEGSP